MQQIKLSTDIRTLSSLLASEANRAFSERAGVQIDREELRLDFQEALGRLLGRRDGNIILTVERPHISKAKAERKVA